MTSISMSAYSSLMTQLKASLIESRTPRTKQGKLLARRLSTHDQEQASMPLQHELSALLAQLQHPMLQLDRRGIVTYANAAAEILLGITNKELVGQNWSQWLLPPWRSSVTTLFEDHQQPLTLPNAQEMKVRHSLGQPLAVFLSMSYIERQGGQFVIGLQDLTYYKQELLRLSQLAMTDSLTGLANRRAFTDRLRHQWEESRRYQDPLSVLMIDVDHFKRINDRCGHQQGDACLQKMAQALASVTPKMPAMAARYGGEEFAIILPKTTGEQATHIAQSLNKKLMSMDFSLNGLPCSLTISQGIATEHQDCYRNADALLFAADTALYRAKVEGRNRINIAK